MADPSPLLFLTDFADQAVIIPAGLAVGLALWLAGWRRGALAWLVAVPVTLAAVATAKVAVFAFGPPAGMPNLRSPSGHTASAAMVYGGLVMMLASRAMPHLRGVLVAGMFAVAFGFTRLALHVHSRPDVMVGALIGMAGAMLLTRLAGDRPDRMRTLIPFGTAVAVILLLHGTRLPAETWLKDAARALVETAP